MELNKFYFHAVMQKEKGLMSMPLTMAREGETNVIKKVGGKEDTRKFLENLGFVTGGNVTVISEINGNLIVNVKESRIAIGKEMANKIMV
jgi:ferrous iron transport protein A